MKPIAARRGFALMAALFIVVTLAAISVYLLTISTGQVAATTQDEQAARAYQAARAGIDWGAFQILRNAGGAFAATTCPANGNTSLTLAAFSGANETPYSVKVECSLTAETEGGTTVNVYVVKATGCNRAACPGAVTATYVERQLQLTLAK